MKRDQADRLAQAFVQAQIACAGNEIAQGGVRLMALMAAKIAAEDGRIEERVFLQKCGIESKSFRQRARVYTDEELIELLPVSAG